MTDKPTRQAPLAKSTAAIDAMQRVLAKFKGVAPPAPMRKVGSTQAGPAQP